MPLSAFRVFRAFTASRQMHENPENAQNLQLIARSLSPPPFPLELFLVVSGYRSRRIRFLPLDKIEKMF
jgi:hypothetical protein